MADAVLLARHDVERGQAVSIAYFRTRKGTSQIDVTGTTYRVTMSLQGFSQLSRDEMNLDVINAMAKFEQFVRLLVVEAVTDTIKEEGTKP